MDNPELKLFTIADLRDWLVTNKPAEGLCEAVIDAQRAWAFVNNPYVKDGDVVLSAVFEGDAMAAYSACFPDMIGGKRSWWFSTLFCRPQYRGKGYGIIAMGSLCEAHEDEEFFDMDGAQETVDVLKYLGFKGVYRSRFFLGEKNIRTDSLKGKMAYQAEQMRRRQFDRFRRGIEDSISRADYKVRYISHIDDLTYRFIKKHSTGDLFLREQKMLNWILSFPFCLRAPLESRVMNRNRFGAAVSDYQLQAVQVWVGGNLVGVYIYRIMDSEFAIKYLYYDKDERHNIYLSIAEHFFETNSVSLKTMDGLLAKWLMENHLTGKFMGESQSFSFPEGFRYVENLAIQGGDGDTFV